MKIRILGDTLRLRLKKSEIDEFAKNGKIKNSISFGNDNKLQYILQVSIDSEISASFINNEIIIAIPKDVAKKWIETDLITLKNNISTPNLIIEKDFKCTSKDCLETENQKNDSYRNPNK